MTQIIIIVVAVFVLFVTFLTLISRYKRCPSDKILVIYGKTGGTSAKCVHGGGAFIWPVIQDYQYLDLKPISIEANFVSGMMKTVPPLNDLFNMAGLNLPTYLKGNDKTEEVKPTASDDITPNEEVK
jgi:hypothetical protein